MRIRGVPVMGRLLIALALTVGTLACVLHHPVPCTGGEYPDPCVGVPYDAGADG